MLLNPLSIMGGAYADNSLTWSAQRTLNWLPETAEVEGTRTPIKFADVPGLRAVVDLGTGSGVRGLENVEGKLFAVSGNDLFEISTAFAATNRGNIPGVSRVSMSHNKQGGTVAANELVIANGLSGYVYNTDTTVLAQITDEAFQGASSFDYVDGYITFTDPQGRWWGHSALNQATSYSSVDRYDAESAPDPIISHIVSHREVMVFGTRTTEFFRNTGAATGTFQRVDGTELEVGICAPFARARVDNSVCWVGDSLEVFRLEGHSPQRISNRPIEQLLHTVNPANVFAFPWEDKGHKVFYITAPEAFTVGFDFASGMWHERQTFDLSRWRTNALVAWNGYWIAGDYANGLLYVLDWDTHHENGLEIVRERASGYTHGGQNKVLAPYVELLFDTGTEAPLFEMTLSGDVPNATQGDAAPSGQVYTALGGFGTVTYAVLSGTFPAGLTLQPNGTVTGTYSTGGTFAWVVQATDSLGNTATVNDGATVSIVEWWMTQSGTIPLDNDLYIGPDAINWPTLTARTPNITPSYGPKALGTGVVVVAGLNVLSTDIERITDLDPSGGITTSLQTLAAGILHIRYVDGIAFAILASGTTYYYSTDQGASWQTASIPGALPVEDIAKMGDRWLTLASGIGGGFYYSDEAVPTTWLFGSPSNPGAPGHAKGYIATSATAAVSFGTTDVKRTTDGITWTGVTGPVGPSGVDRRDGLSVGGVFVCQYDQRGSISRSTDDGLTWSEVFLSGIQTTEVVQRLEQGAGRVVASTTNGNVWASTDSGASWTISTVVGGSPAAATMITRVPA